MKRLMIFMLAMTVAVAIGLGSFSTPAYAYVTLQLKANWNPNAETDMDHYRLWHLNGGEINYYNPTSKNFSGTTWNDSYKIPKTLSMVEIDYGVAENSTGTLQSRLAAVDTALNISTPAEYAYIWTSDITPPGIPTGFVIAPR